MQVIDTALVNIIGGPPRAVVKPRRPQDTETAPKMQTVFDYHVHEDHFAEKQPLFVQQALIYGITAAKNHWIYKEADRVRPLHMHNPYDAYRPITFQTNERITLRDGPTFEPWDMYGVSWEPNARDVDSAAYIVLDSWFTKEELLDNARTERNPFGLYEISDLQKLFKAGPDNGRTANAQERLLGGTYDKWKDRFRVREVWRDDTFTVLGSRQVILRHGQNPYWHGKKPIVIAQPRPDLFELQGIPETELLDDLQQAMHTIQNMVIDNLHLTVQRGITYRESGVLDPNALDLRPRFKWGVTDHDDIQFQQPPPLPAEAYRERETIKADMQLITGINPYISGSDMAGVDQNTATGITALQEVASRLLRFKARQIAYKGTQRTFEQWSDLIQQFMTKEQAIRIEGAGGISWEHVSPQEIVGNYDLSVEGNEESLSRQQQRGEMMGLLQALQPFAQLNIVNWQSILEKVAQAYDIEPSSIMAPAPTPAAMPAPAPQGQPQQNGQAPQADPLLGGQALPAQIQGAITGGGQ